MRRSMAGNLPGVSVDDCKALLHLVSSYHIPAFDKQPHVLVHGDLQPSNMIVNEQQLKWHAIMERIEGIQLT